MPETMAPTPGSPLSTISSGSLSPPPPAERLAISAGSSGRAKNGPKASTSISAKSQGSGAVSRATNNKATISLSNGKIVKQTVSLSSAQAKTPNGQVKKNASKGSSPPSAKTKGKGKGAENGRFKGKAKAEDNQDIKKVVAPQETDEELQGVITYTQHLYRPPQNEIEELSDLQIADDWQAAYVWAFLERFGYVGTARNRVAAMWTLDELENALQMDGMDQALSDILEALLRSLGAIRAERPRPQNANRKGRPEPIPKPTTASIEADLRALISSRLQADRYTIFHAYVFETKARVLTDSPNSSKTDEIIDSKMSGEWQQLHPLLTESFTDSSWQKRIKVLRQLVDWTLEENSDIRDRIAEAYSDRLKVEKVLDEEAKKSIAEARYDDIDKVLLKSDEPDGLKAPANAFDVLSQASGSGTVAPREKTPYEALLVRPLGRDSDNKRIVQVDCSFRVYLQGNPYHAKSEWRNLSKGREAYEALLRQYWSKGAQLKTLREAYSSAKGAKKTSVNAELDKAKRDYQIGKALLDRRGMIKDHEEAIEKDRIRISKAIAKKLELEAFLLAREQEGPRTRTRGRRVDYSQFDKDPGDDEYEEEEEEVYSAPRQSRAPARPAHTNEPFSRSTSHSDTTRVSPKYEDSFDDSIQAADSEPEETDADHAGDDGGDDYREESEDSVRPRKRQRIDSDDEDFTG